MIDFNSFFVNATIASVLILALSYDYITKYFNYWYVRHIPYLKPIPVFGNDFKRIFLIAHTTKLVGDLYEKYKTSKYVGYFKGRKPDMIVRDPETIGLILEKDFVNFKNRGLGLSNSKDYALSDNLYFCEGEKWEYLREKLDDIINGDLVKPVLNKELSVGPISGEINVTDVAIKFACEAMLFGESNSYKIAKELQKRDSISDYFINIFPSLYKTFGFRTVSGEMDQLLDDMLKETSSGMKCVDILKKLKRVDDRNLIEKKTNKIRLDDKTVKAQIVHIIKHGIIPCSNIISIILYELSKNQDLQNEIYEEICQNFWVDLNNLERHKILLAVTKECQRLYPFISVIQRVCVSTYKIPETSIVIDKDVTVQIPVLAIHTDEKYFDRPREFLPRRFLDDKFDRRKNYTYMPFGIGPRRCIGEPMSILTIMSAVAVILRSVTVKPCHKTPTEVNMVDNGLTRKLESDIWLEFKLR